MEPIQFWEFMSLILVGLGYERYTFSCFPSERLFLNNCLFDLDTKILVTYYSSKNIFIRRKENMLATPRLYFWFYVVFRPRIKIPASVMMPIARMVERVYTILAPYGMKVPQLTPSRIRLLTCNRTFNSAKANDRLGYLPIVPLQVHSCSILIFRFYLICLIHSSTPWA